MGAWRVWVGETVTGTSGWLAAIAGATSDTRQAIYDRGANLPPNSGLKDFAPALRGLSSTPAQLPPADWPDLSVGMPANALRGLVKIKQAETENHVAFSVTCPSGTYTVAWGDGTSNTYASGATAEHSWVWTDGTPCSEGYRVAVVEVTATATITGLDLIYLPAAWATDWQGYWSVWLDLYASLPNLTSLRIGQNREVIIHRWLRRIGGNLGAIQSNASSMFAYCMSLTRLPDVLNLGNVTNASGMFYFCTSLTRLPSTGLKVGASLQSTAMGRVALNNFFTGLGTATGSQVINITSCPGRTTCDRTIATTKGWTVTG